MFMAWVETAALTVWTMCAITAKQKNNPSNGKKLKN
jgi:hypothetical protein